MFGSFKGKSGGGFKKPFKKDFGGPKELHDATCAKCNKMCQVPFKPNGRKPIFCSDCFVRDENPEGGSPYEKRSFEKRPYFKEEREERRAPYANDRSTDRGMSEIATELKAVNAKLGLILKALTEDQE
jgi:CxxC-x17-CxxC domain-containing protein